MTGLLGKLNERLLIWAWPSGKRVGEWLCESSPSEMGEDVH